MEDIANTTSDNDLSLSQDIVKEVKNEIREFSKANVLSSRDVNFI